MVVLDEYGGGTAIHFIEHVFGKGMIYRRVCFPVGLVKSWLNESVVTEGAKAPHWKRRNSTLLFNVGSQTRQGVGGIAGRNHYPVVFVNRKVIAGPSAMSDPGSGAFLHEGINGGGDPSRRCADAQLALDEFVDIGLAIGDNYNPVVANLTINQSAEPVCVQTGLAPFPLPLPEYPSRTSVLLWILAHGKGKVKQGNRVLISAVRRDVISGLRKTGISFSR